jgi:uncharacterized protein
VAEKKQPVRTCVACRSSGGKKGFVRLVKTPDGAVEIDPTGKRAGRGAYICPTRECLAVAVKKKSIERGLRTEVPRELMEKLKGMAEKDNEDAQGAGAVG